MILPDISRAFKLLILLVTILIIPTGLQASSGENDQSSHASGAVDTKEEINAYIQHHLHDSHDFILWTNGKTGHHVGFPLPVILFDDGFHFFMSSKFHHGEEVVESNGKFFTLAHSKIYSTDEAGTLKLDDHGHIKNSKPLDFSVTKSVFGMLLVGLLLILGFGSLARGYKKSSIPTGVGRLLEPLVIYVRDEIARPNIGEKKYKKFMSFLLTVFFFIWIANLLGLTPLGFNITGQIAVTACLAIFTLVVYLTSGSKDFWAHTLWMPGVPVILRPILAVIELIGFIIIKPFSLLVRLFANITAGHFVVMSLIALMITMKASFGPIASTGMSFLLATFITVIEVLVAFLQAFIFTMLSSLFIGMAVEEHEHH